MTSYHNSFTHLSTLLYLSCFHIIIELSKSTSSLEIAAICFAPYQETKQTSSAPISKHCI
ncbi:hypothetical protein HMPREF9134_00599 [Porphyromonas catoniae F0037]|uniref:Uncharacterized protein n=1 Tax=Porphyromonas catoniae F0037 TaxID=1127696 RepID=L1NFZ6_9PORP|nr:hypothetical protein HMPREF9134_00599 [Porphyromonas catoniae F0037]